MASRTKKRAAAAGAAGEALPIDGKPAEPEAPPPPEWMQLLARPEMGFFELLAALPDSVWDELIVYVYRLDPVLKNKQGEKSYIGKYAMPIDEEVLKQNHGGGKYELYLNGGEGGRDTLKHAKIRIDGPPKVQEGQTIEGQLATPSAPVKSDLAAALEVANKASNAGIAIMETGMKNALEMQKGQSQSVTGNPLADKFVDAIIKKLDTPAPAPAVAPAMDPLLAKLLDAAITAFTKRENPAPAATDAGLTQLTLIKELFGAETLADLVEKMRGDGTRGSGPPWWGSLLTSAIEKAPTILAQLMQMQQEAFQRTLLAHQAINGGRVMLPPSSLTGNATAAIPGATPNPAPGAETAPPVLQFTQEQIQVAMQSIVAMIGSAFDRGFDGWQAAASVDLQFPDALEAMESIFADPNMLTSFVAGIPELAARAAKPEWPRFQEEFLEYMNEGEDEEEEVQSGGSSPPPTVPPAVAAAAPAPERQPGPQSVMAAASKQKPVATPKPA